MEEKIMDYEERTQTEARVEEVYQLADWARDWGYEDVNTTRFDGLVPRELEASVREVAESELNSA